MAGRAITVAITLAGGLVAATFTIPEAVAFSGFAAGMLKAVLAVLAFWAFDRWVLPGDACEEVIERGNVAYGLLLVALGLILAATVATAAPLAAVAPPYGVVSVGVAETPARAGGEASGALAPRWGVPPAVPVVTVQHRADGPRPAHVTAALRYVGTRELTGRNDGPAVARFLRSVGIGFPAPWCAGFVRTALDDVGADVVDASGASIRSPVATVWLRGRGRIEARTVERGLGRPPRGSVVVWRNGSGWTGHAAVLDWWDRRCGETVEGNTSSGTAGSQRDGNGVWQRTRCVSPGSYFRIVGFVPVTPAPVVVPSRPSLRPAPTTTSA